MFFIQSYPTSIWDRRLLETQRLLETLHLFVHLTKTSWRLIETWCLIGTRF